MPNIPVFDPNSEQARAISDLFLITLSIAMGIVLLVSGLIIFVALKYRQLLAEAPSQQQPKQVSRNLKLEIAWTVGPLVLLTLLFIPTLIVMGKADPAVSAQAQQHPDLEIVGHQWWWEYRYPKAGVVTANSLYLPQGQRVLAKLQSADVIHDFWVPQLVRKMDANPGQPNYLWLQADKEGVLHGACAEYCGTQHAWMQISVHVVTPQAFSDWMAQQQQIPPTPTGQAAYGQQVFLSNTCATCHRIAGTSAQAGTGPDLTHLMSRQTLGTGIVENNPANLRRWVQNVQAIKPGVHMPSFEQLSSQDLDDLTAYLQTLK